MKSEHNKESYCSGDDSEEEAYLAGEMEGWVCVK